MSILLNFLRSLLLTSLLSFAAPILLIGGIWVILCAIAFLPGLESISQSQTEMLIQFLATFGSGQPRQGLWVIGLTCSLVGALFDIYAFYRYQTLRGE